jgi:hypothetical protein
MQVWVHNVANRGDGWISLDPLGFQHSLLKKHIWIILIQHSSCILRLIELTDELIWHLEFFYGIHIDNFFRRMELTSTTQNLWRVGLRPERTPAYRLQQTQSFVVDETFEYTCSCICMEGRLRKLHGLSLNYIIVFSEIRLIYAIFNFKLTELFFDNHV